ncbi:unnamed protein product [Sphagnum troendelagicum]|uniref:RING-type E3 ubiquitin transferase n=1 Tax=Sphagnum troendelagicum TaxID=128251 RepID=A0ABP0UTR6_9BRYO
MSSSAPLPPAAGTSPFNPSSPPSAYMVNSKIMVVAVAVLFGVVLFVFCIHVYAKWFWRNHAAGSIAAASNLQAGPGGSSAGAGAAAHSVSWSRRRRAGQLNFLMGDHHSNNNNNNHLAPHFLGDGVGLDKAVVELLPTFVYRAAEMKGSSVLECAVCLEEFEEKETGRLLPRCNHSFHLDCIDMWFHSHSSCPLCRTSVKPDKASPPHESWHLLDQSNPAAGGPASDSPNQQQLLQVESRNMQMSSTQAASEASGSSLNTVRSSAGAPGAAGGGVSSAHISEVSTQQVHVAGGMDLGLAGSDQQERIQAPTTRSEKGQEPNGSNSHVGPAYIPPNVLFWGTHDTHLNAAAAQSPATTTILQAVDSELQEQQQQQQGPFASNSGSAGGGQASNSAVAVEISMATTRSPVAVAEAEGSSRSHMARLVSLKHLLSKGRPTASSSPTLPIYSSQTSEIEKGESSSPSSSSSSRIPETSTALNIMGFFMSS